VVLPGNGVAVVVVTVVGVIVVDESNDGDNVDGLGEHDVSSSLLPSSSTLIFPFVFIFPFGYLHLLPPMFFIPNLLLPI
jgi:hypothetical protein